MDVRNLWVSVPTYWTHPTSKPGPETTIFDHPTPLDEEGTLARTLESFTTLRGEFSVLVVAAAAHTSLGEQVHAQVGELLRPFSGRLKLHFVSPVHLKAINAALPEPILALDSYGNIRNVQLIVPFAMGAGAVLGIDDDEVMLDPDHIAKVAAHIGRDFNGTVVGGIAGPYFDRTGEYRLPGAESLADCGNIFIKKNYFMNEALKKVMAHKGIGPLVRSNVAFGGNMTMSRATIASACHDPYIPRGEDYDYVVNAAMAGITFFFSPNTGILHLPPDSTGPQAGDSRRKLMADIRRFIYMQEKMRQHAQLFPGERVDMSYLAPYPAPYLEPGEDLRAAAVDALRKTAPAGEPKGFPEEFTEQACRLAAKKAAEFFEYRRKWARITSRLEADAAMRGALAAAIEMI